MTPTQPSAHEATRAASASATRSSATAPRSSRRGDDGRRSRPPSAATSSRTRTSSSRAGCPCSGANYYTLKAEFQTAQAVTPGQGQAVTIAGAKIGEIASVDLHEGVAVVTMKITPKYARLYKNATLLLRPKTQLQDITVEVNPGTPVGRQAAQRRSDPALTDRAERRLRRVPRRSRRGNARLPAGAPRRRRPGLQEQLARVRRRRSSASTRPRATGRRSQRSCEARHANIAHSIHNFRLLMEALGAKDKQLAQLVDSSNAVFATFAQEEREPAEARCTCCPARCARRASGLGKLGDGQRRASARRSTSSQPFARSLGRRPAKPRRRLALKHDADLQERNPAVRAPDPARGQRAGSRDAAARRSVPEARHELRGAQRILQRARLQPRARARAASCSSSTGATTTSTASSAAPTPTARSAAASCTSTATSSPILNGVCRSQRRRSTLLIGLLKPPTAAECASQGVGKGAAVRGAGARGRAKTPKRAVLRAQRPAPSAVRRRRRARARPEHAKGGKG